MHFKIVKIYIFFSQCANLAWAKAFMTHVNPFTGRDLAHEPALRFLCLINEGNVGNFKRERPEGWERIAADNERRFFRRMKRILREEIGQAYPEYDLLIVPDVDISD